MITTLPVQISKSVHSKKIILDTCTKTAFSFNNITYEQKDSVSMGSSLGPNMANIIMTELENKVIKPLINVTGWNIDLPEGHQFSVSHGLEA